MTLYVSMTAVLRAAREFARTDLINSGALVQFHPEDLTISVVAPSADTHVAPRYPYAAEAPRVCEEYSLARAADAWLEWMAKVVEAPECEVRRHRPLSESRRRVAQAIAKRIIEIRLAAWIRKVGK